jgi:hypothetical protein
MQELFVREKKQPAQQPHDPQSQEAGVKEVGGGVEEDVGRGKGADVNGKTEVVKGIADTSYIIPLLTELEKFGSELVCTVTSPAALAGPNVHPASVTVTAVEAESAAPVTDITIDVTPGACGVRTVSGVDEVAVGVAEVERKPGG